MKRYTLSLLQIITRLVIRTITPVLGIRYIENSENAKRGVVIANHIAASDPFLIGSVFNFRKTTAILPIRFMTANKYYDNPILRIFIVLLGGFPAYVHKNKKYGIEASMHFLTNNQSVLLFPQGRRDPERNSRLHAGAKVISEGRFVTPILISEKNRHKYIVEGSPFLQTEMSIEQMMDKVWELEKHIK